MKTLLPFIALLLASPLPDLRAVPANGSTLMVAKPGSSLNFPQAQVTIKSGRTSTTVTVGSTRKIETPNGTIWTHEVLANGAKVVWECTPDGTSDLYEVTVSRNGKAEEGSLKFRGNAKSITVGDIELSVK